MQQPVKKKHGKQPNTPATAAAPAIPATPASAPSQPWKNLIHAWIFIPALLYFGVFLQYAPNIPVMDDYEAVLGFLLDFKSASFGHKMALLFSQHTEHRILHSRVIFALYYSIFGDVNFRNLMFIANLQLVGIFLVCVHFIRKCGGKYWSVIAFIWGLLVFDLNTYENGSIAMYGMVNYGVIMLFLVSLYLYTLDKKYLPAAAFVQFLCIFSSGNGLAGSLFIVIYTLLSGSKVKKITSIAVMVVSAVLYFTGYKTTGGAMDASPFVFTIALPYFIKMNGAPFSFDNAMAYGVILLVVFAIVFPYKKILKNSPLLPIILIVAYALAAMATITIFRSNMKGAQFQTSRYLIYPQLLIAAAATFLIIRFNNKKAQLAVVIGAVLVLLKVYADNFKFGKAGFERTANRAERFDYYHPDKKYAQQISESACKEGIYCLQDER